MGSSYLLCIVAGRRYAFDLSQISEVFEQAATWPIPLAPPYYRGAMNFHGSIVAVMDLAQFLGLSGSFPAERLIVLAPTIASLAFAVDSIIRITPAGQADVIDVGSDAPPCSIGELVLPEGQAILLDGSAIAARAADTIND